MEVSSCPGHVTHEFELSPQQIPLQIDYDPVLKCPDLYLTWRVPSKQVLL
jgi:hypothetical protein